MSKLFRSIEFTFEDPMDSLLRRVRQEERRTGRRVTEVTVDAFTFHEIAGKRMWPPDPDRPRFEISRTVPLRAVPAQDGLDIAYIDDVCHTLTVKRK